MRNTIEIKSMSKEAAIQRALKILEATPEQVVKVEEKIKSKSFLGIFNKEGVYLITVDKSPRVVKEQEKPPVKEEIPVQQQSKAEPVKKEIEVKEVKEVTETKETVKKEPIKKEVQKEVSKELPKKEAVKPSKQEKEELILEKARQLLKHMDLALDAEISSREGKFYVVNLFGEDNGIIIGKKGKTLNSFEYLLNSMLKDCKIEIDVEGFKEKRKETLRDLAKKMAKKALSTNKVIRLNPMPPRERKIIHEVINKFEDLDTFSEGLDPKRYIVIRRKRAEKKETESKDI